MVLAQDERLVEFSFSSRIDSALSPESMLRLARRAWSANRRAGLSGFMRLDGLKLDQTIEGPSTRILRLASRILTDPRHCEIRIDRFSPIGVRRFTDWSTVGFDAHAPDPAAAGGSRRRLRLLAGDSGQPDPEDTAGLALALAT